MPWAASPGRPIPDDHVAAWISQNCAVLCESQRWTCSNTKAGLIKRQFIALDAPLPLEFFFDLSVDVAEPWDRTPSTE
jgi:hypothetical protein